MNDGPPPPCPSCGRATVEDLLTSLVAIARRRAGELATPQEVTIFRAGMEATIARRVLLATLATLEAEWGQTMATLLGVRLAPTDPDDPTDPGAPVIDIEVP